MNGNDISQAIKLRDKIETIIIQEESEENLDPNEIQRNNIDQMKRLRDTLNKTIEYLRMDHSTV
jgi:hypothetical protein